MQGKSSPFDLLKSDFRYIKGASLHALQATMRIGGHSLDKAFQTCMAINKVLASHGYTKVISLPDILAKEKAAKDKFLKEVVPV